MTGFEYAWAAWAGAFVVIEGVALYRKDKNDTLSEQVWKIFHTAQGQQKTKTTQVRRAVLTMFLAWLVAHFLTGGKV
ncbi:membrane protein [Streptomyces phage Triumph]|nr:membrane protein [Streptomyces phage Triumph]